MCLYIVGGLKILTLWTIESLLTIAIKANFDKDRSLFSTSPPPVGLLSKLFRALPGYKIRGNKIMQIMLKLLG